MMVALGGVPLDSYNIFQRCFFWLRQEHSEVILCRAPHLDAKDWQVPWQGLTAR